MNATTQQQHKLDIAQRAAGSYMLMQISISTWDGVKLNRAATRDAAVAAEAHEGSGRLYVNLLGSHHADLKVVKAAYAAMRDYLYANTLPFCNPGEGQQRRGDRLVAVDRVPKVLTELNTLAAKANAARDQFLQSYDHFVEVARRDDLGRWARGVEHPSAAEVRQRFQAVVQPPKPLTVVRAEDLPASLGDFAAEIAAQHAATAVAMLDNAKREALDAAHEHTERLHRQLDSGQRFHQSLLDATLRHADMLESMARGTDNDPGLIEAARMLREECANVKDVESWRVNPSSRRAAKAAAHKVRGVLADALKEQDTLTAPAPAPTPTPAASGSADGVQVGGVLADLW